MSNLKLFLLSIFLILTMTNSVFASEETDTQQNNQTMENETQESSTDNDMEQDFSQEDLSQGNVLESPENIEIFKRLGFDTKESITKDELKTLYEKVFLRREFGQDEIGFFQKMIDKILIEVPEKIENSAIKNYFEMPFLMTFITEETTGSVEDTDADGVEVIKDEKKKDEI